MTSGMERKDDALTLAAIGVLAMCVVTFDHEALGHGGACLLLGGHIRLLTSSLFRCSLPSGWIDPAGPATNLAIATLASLVLPSVPASRARLRLFLTLVAAFGFFWEGGYLIHAMHRQDGDLYFFAQFILGRVTLLERLVGAILGLALYVFAIGFTSRALLDLWPEAQTARRAARIVWLSATAGAALAALAYAGQGWRDLHDAVLEIGAASIPLLIVPWRGGKIGHPQALLVRSPIVIGLAVVVYALFVATLGRGITS